VFLLARILTLAFDAVVAPFGPHRLAALLTVSLLGGAVLALVFRATSKQAAIARSREVFKARILEMRLYPDDIVLITRAFGGALAAQGAYLKHAALGIVAAVVLAAPLFVQVEQRFAAGALRAGDRTLISATLADGVDPRTADASLSGPAATEVDTRSLRVRASREVVWVVDVRDRGRHEMELKVGNEAYQFPLEAEESCRAIGRRRSASSWVDAGTQVGLPRIPAGASVEGVRVRYPDAHYRLLGVGMNWLAVFLVGTLVGAILPARLMRIHL
jgi:hypothetical protein